MRDLAEVIAGWMYALQIMSGRQWVLRLIVLASGVGTAILCDVWFPVLLSTPLLVTAVMLALTSVVRPDSVTPMLFIAVVALCVSSGRRR